MPLNLFALSICLPRGLRGRAKADFARRGRIGVALFCIAFGGSGDLRASDHGRDEAVVAEVLRLCENYERGFFSSATDLAYGARLDGPRGTAVLERPEEVSRRCVRGEYCPWGYGSGIENVAYHNGMLLYALCDAEAATREPALAALARRTFRGLIRLAMLSPVSGFVPRGPHPEEPSLYYPDSSLDQHGVFVCGLWRYYRSDLATPAERDTIRPTIGAVLRRFEANAWAILVEDGSTAAHAGGDMLPMRPTQSAFLLTLLAIARDVTEEPRWRSAYERFSEESGGRRWQALAAHNPESPDARFNNFMNQDALRLHTLRRLEADPVRREILRRRLARTARGMLASDYIRQWNLSWLMSEPWHPNDAETANAYLRPLGLSLESRVSIMDLWRRCNVDLVSPETLPGQRNRYEPITLAVPALAWQIALLSGDAELLATVAPAVTEMLRRVDFARIDLGWAYNYAVLAALWRLAQPPISPVAS